jgi:RNA polymerase sigma factor (sigma-70 family)
MASVAADDSPTDLGQSGFGLDERWALVVPHREHLVAIAARRCPTQQDAEDCAHEAMLRAVGYRQLDPARVGALLTAIVLRVSADLARRRGAELRGRPRLAMVPAQLVPPDEAVLDHDEARWLAEQLERLPAREREVFEHRAAGLSAAETARLLALSYKSVESAFTRARGRLRLWATRTAWLFSCSRGWTQLRRRLIATPAHAGEFVASLMSVATLLALVVGETALAPPVATQNVRTPTSVAPRAGMAKPASAMQPAAAGTSELHVSLTAAPTNVALRRAPQSVPDPRLLPLPGTDPRSVWAVTDVQASPNYSSDHTLYAAGTPTLCVLSPCAAIFKSTDGGHSWISLEALGLVGGMLPAGTHLMLPPAAYAQHRFYAYGEGGLQVTTDGGRTFTTVVSQPAVDGVGYAAAAPAGMGFDVMTSLQSLTVYSAGAVPKVVALFPPTMQAFAAPLFVSGPNGPEILQLVQLAEGNVKQMTRLLRCTPQCTKKVRPTS